MAGRKKLCRKSYSLLFKFLKNRFDSYSLAMKAAETVFPSAINLTKCKDTHVHKCTFPETEELFQRNFVR